ncbi:hypothetical protein EZ428_05240 [Pedobacter frigiditerrae]|uniref:Uncharacterized protein n=1 Tax=Pedobacter frigiditerrae TaxID=2530452 RepID=A0A4R0N7F8_9SPHI|nr:hypothetical protein [Pedobacter frigiditerrae]TCC94184.1 hypothetical protein EZ428_05240 [Pedobacter frigiditerrae]
MRHLEKAWVRIVIALLLGGVLREAIFISTGEPNRPRGANYDVITLAYFAGVYLILTFYVRSKKKNTVG